MKIILLQVSDIHFRESNNTILKRTAAITRAVQGVDAEVETVFVTMTGDVAFSGSRTEYAIAHGFFDELKKELLTLRPNVRVEEIFIPGNHDCVLKPENRVRKTVLDAILKDVEPPYHPDDEFVAECSKVQDNFFLFRAQRLSSSETPVLPLQGAERLFYRHNFQIGPHRLRFDCYNTAWMSQVHEQPGQLLTPLGLATVEGSADDDVVISLFHHPYGWLDPNNARAFRKEVERVSDVVMTGHEHIAEQYHKLALEGAANEYFEGAVLQESGRPESGFNVLLLDLDRRERKILLYEWEKDFYQPRRTDEWRPLDRNIERGASHLENTAVFAEYLHDVGANFTHPAKPRLDLEDVFVYPDFDERTYLRDNTNNILVSTKAGDNLLAYIIDHANVLFTGGDLCGKTSLSKKLYLDLQEKGFEPLLIDGKNIRTADSNALSRLLDESVAHQYGAEAVERYRQLNREQKVIVLDNFHTARLNLRGQNGAVEYLNKAAGHVVVLASDVLQFHDFARQSEEHSVLLGFQYCDIREFGAQLRGRLIEKWFELGHEFTANEHDTVHRIKDAENLVSTLLGKNLLPSHPLFILTILQQYEMHSNLETASGSYGYYYEVLITTSLQNRSKHIPLDMTYPFISRIAYRMFEKRVKSLSEDEMEEVAEEYRKLHQVGFSSEEMRRILEEAHLLHVSSEGRYKFQYKYIGYYFVARYIKDNLYTRAHGTQLRSKIRDMAGKLYVEDYANILIFLVYLTKDEETINEILAKAKALFAEYEPCDFAGHMSFINRLSKEPLPLALPDGPEKEHRDERRARMDKNHVTQHDEEKTEDLAQEQEDKDLDDILKLNVAVKTLQIMGQVLRNFPGTLSGDTKVEIARESYLLGLRSLRVFFAVLESDFQNFRSVIQDILQEQRNFPLETEEQRKELSRHVDDFIYAIMLGGAYGFVKRISYAVGSEYLKETYKRVIDPRVPLSIELINISIKLDHFKQFPTDEVVDLHTRIEKNAFTDSILRRMVWDYFYLYPSDFRIRQSVCTKLNIRFSDPKMLGGAHKKQ